MGFAFDQTGCTEKLDFDLFKCNKRLEHDKQMKNGLIVWFCLRVMVHKMSKMIHFANVYAEINKKYTHFMVIRLVNLKDLIMLFQKMVQIIGFSATAQEILSPNFLHFCWVTFFLKFRSDVSIYGSIVYFVSNLGPIWYQHQCQDIDLEGVVVQKKQPKGNGSTVTRAQYHV